MLSLVRCIPHIDRVCRCSNGRGVDRHLLGLRVLSQLHDIAEPRLLQSVAYKKSTTYKLSTSQMFFPHYTGGFAASEPDGYGIYIQIIYKVENFYCSFSKTKAFAIHCCQKDCAFQLRDGRVVQQRRYINSQLRCAMR